MQITFDPLNAQEAEAVAKFLRPERPVYRVQNVAVSLTAEERAEFLKKSRTYGSVLDPDDETCGAAISQLVADGALLDPADSPDVGAIPRSELSGEQLRAAYEAPLGASAIPLPPAAAPLPAAATLFSTAPEAPQDGAPAAPIVPPPPVPSAPPVAVPPAPAAPAPRAENGDLDKDGLPWDQRIHSGSKEKNKDGTWRQRRNLPEGTKETVEAELRRLMAIPVPAVPVSAVPLPPPVPVPPVADTVTSTATTDTDPANVSPAAAPAGPDVPNVPAPPTSAPVTAPIPTPPVPPAPTAAVPSAPVTFAGMMKMVTSGIQERKFTEADVHVILADFGLGAGDIGQLAKPLDNMREALQQVAKRVRELTGDAV